MRRTWLTLPILVLVLTLPAACSTIEETMVSALLRNYVSAQEALAADDPQSARLALNALATEGDPEISQVALAAAQSEDLETIRKKFKELSASLEKGELPQGYVVAFCPMADEGNGATWVQKEGEIKNPYFGTEMLSCGEVKERGK